MNAYLRKILRDITSALKYEAVTYTDGEYNPPSLFKGLHISVAGDVAIKGVDGVTTVLTLTPGCWPYGGDAIIESGTTSTGIVVLF